MSGTAEIHDATLTPTKLELLAGWLPSQDWFHGSADDLTRVASYRFVDPDGEAVSYTHLEIRRRSRSMSMILTSTSSLTLTTCSGIST